MRVCYFGTYEQSYPRNKVVIDAMRMAGVEVLECHHPLWELIRHKTGPFLSPRSLLAFTLRFLKGYVKLIVTFLRRAGDAQLVMVGYIGQLDLVLAKLLSMVGKRRKLIFNPLVSLYDTLVDDRSLFSPDSLAAHFLFFLDRLAFRLADRIILDTDVHIDYISEKFGIDRDKFERVFIGADEEVFSSRPWQKRLSPFVVLFVGKFIPLHGIPYIITAASMLEEEDIRFEIVGSGQLYDEIMELYRRLAVKNIAFTDWIPYQQLADKMAQANLCLGIFGESGKARRVIPNKVFQGLAVGMPVITGDSPASRELLTGGQSAALVPMANPEALAGAIRTLKGDRALRKKIALGGQEIFRRRCSTEALGKQLKALCQRMLRRT